MRSDAQKDPSIEPNAIRVRLLIDQAEVLGLDPREVDVPVVGDHAGVTILPLLSQVDRKLVKQTVMTSVYGVTYTGARDQIKRRLKERCAIEDDAELFAAACYAAKTTLTALGEMFEAARSIMSWLGDCAKPFFLAR